MRTKCIGKPSGSTGPRRGRGTKDDVDQAMGGRRVKGNGAEAGLVEASPGTLVLAMAVDVTIDKGTAAAWWHWQCVQLAACAARPSAPGSVTRLFDQRGSGRSHAEIGQLVLRARRDRADAEQEHEQHEDRQHAGVPHGGDQGRRCRGSAHRRARYRDGAALCNFIRCRDLSTGTLPVEHGLRGRRASTQGQMPRANLPQCRPFRFSQCASESVGRETLPRAATHLLRRTPNSGSSRAPRSSG